MRDTTEALVGHYLDHLALSGDVLEIYAGTPSPGTAELFAAPRFRLRGVDIAAVDLADCRDVLADASFDVVVSADVFEHLERPWLAAAEIGRILRPGGLAVTHTLFSWPSQPRRGDYWRFSPAGLEFLFGDLDCLETGYDLSGRRPEDKGAYSVTRRGPGVRVPRFGDSDHPLAGSLQMDIEGTVTDPERREVPSAADPIQAIRPELGDVSKRLAGLEQLIIQRTRQLDDIAARSKRLERRLERLSASLPVRAARSVRNGLHTLLK